MNVAEDGRERRGLDRLDVMLRARVADPTLRLLFLGD